MAAIQCLKLTLVLLLFIWSLGIALECWSLACHPVSTRRLLAVLVTFVAAAWRPFGFDVPSALRIVLFRWSFGAGCPSFDAVRLNLVSLRSSVAVGPSVSSFGLSTAVVLDR